MGQHDASPPDRADDEPADLADERVGDAAGQPALAGLSDDDVLVQRARELATLPLAERPDAFDALNRDVVAALRAIEDL